MQNAAPMLARTARDESVLQQHTANVLLNEDRMTRPVIAVVEDDPALAMLITDLLLDEGYDPRVWRNHQEAFTFIWMQQPQLVILDVWLFGHNYGMQLLERVAQHPPLATMPLVVYSGDTNALDQHAAMLNPHRSAVLAKPFELDDLLDAIHRLLAVAPATR